MAENETGFLQTAGAGRQLNGMDVDPELTHLYAMDRVKLVWD